MATTDESGASKYRPEPQQAHVEAAEAQEQRNQAIKRLMLEKNLPWDEAAKQVDKAAVAQKKGPEPEPKKPEPSEAKTEPIKIVDKSKG